MLCKSNIENKCKNCLKIFFLEYKKFLALFKLEFKMIFFLIFAVYFCILGYFCSTVDILLYS